MIVHWRMHLRAHRPQYWDCDSTGERLPRGLLFDCRHECFSGRVVPERFRDGVVQGIDNHAVRAAERLFLAVRHDGHPIPEPEVQGRAAVESKLAFRGTGKHVSSNTGGTGERIYLDLLERLDPGRGEKFGTD